MMWSSGVDEAFSGTGVKAGLEIWCIENLRLVPVPKSSHGKFFSGSAYIILNTTILKRGIYLYDIHYWVGKDAEEGESTMASDKALELDAALGSRAVHYKEDQGNETEKFLSYFKPCIIPIEGIFTSDVEGDGKGAYRVTLLACKGDHAVHVKEVPFSRSSLNHNDVFILDTESKIFLFSGCNSSIQERAKALEVVQYINENQHGGRCKVATIEDGKFVGDSDAGEFWSKFGGYAPIARELPHTKLNEKHSPAKLFWVNKRKLLYLDPPSLNKGLLSSDRCYMLDCDAEIFVWMGRTTLISERKTAVSAVEEFMQSQDRPISMLTTFLTEGSETAKFKSYFSDWPQKATSSLYIEGLGKVAAIFKNQGYDVKEIPEDDYQPIIDSHGILKVWLVNCQDFTALSAAEQTMLYSGNCYIVKYTYSVNDKDNNLFYAWIGSNSTLEDKVDAISLLITMTNSIKCPFVMAQISEGSLSLPTDHDLIDRLLDLINPLKQCTTVREGNEPGIFWDIIGGKADYPKDKDIKEYTEDPHLFTCIFEEGNFKGKEIFNFTQDDLTTEDILLLDCHNEIYVWVGQHASNASPEKALTLGKKFLEADILLEGLPQETAIYVVLEGNEPPFFTRYFDWDTSKPYMHGNSFERKLAILKGSASVIESPNRGILKTNFRYSSEGLPDHSLRKSATSDGSHIGRGLSSDGSSETSYLAKKDPSNSDAKLEALEIEDNEENCDADNGLQAFPYEHLKASSGTALAGIDITRREAYLSNEEFKDKFGMNKKAFYKLPKWKQNKLKQDLNLF